MWSLLALVVTALTVPLDFNYVGGFVILTLPVGLIAVFLLPRLLPAKDRYFAVKILALGLLIKFVGIGIRLWFAEGVYGYGDSERYARAGNEVAQLIRAGQFSAATGGIDDGTRYTEVLTGFIFLLTGASWWGVSIFFGLFAVVGLLLFYRAFRIAFPTSDARIYLVALLFFPSLVFWPSTIGKEALLVLSSGVIVYGVALVLVQKRMIGLLPLALGFVFAFPLREPVALAMVAGFVPAIMLMRPRPTIGGRFAKLALMATVLVLAPLFFLSVLRSLDVENPSLDAIISRVVTQTNRDYDSATGSNYDVLVPTDPLWVPTGMVTVLVRPFPWETKNVQAMLQSFDGVLTGAVIFISLFRLYKYGGDFRSRSFLIYLLGTSIALMLVLGVLGNFGLLARQRTVVMPFVLMLLAIPGPPRREPASRGGVPDIDSYGQSNTGHRAQAQHPILRQYR